MPRGGRSGSKTRPREAPAADVRDVLARQLDLPRSEHRVEVSVGDLVLHAAERESIGAGADVYACIRAEDVTIETRSPGQASTRNHLAARVVAIAAEGPVDRVTLDCGFAIDALITRRSREEMQLSIGARVTAAVKATAIHLVPRA